MLQHFENHAVLQMDGTLLQAEGLLVSPPPHTPCMLQGVVASELFHLTTAPVELLAGEHEMFPADEGLS